MISRIINFLRPSPPPAPQPAAPTRPRPLYIYDEEFEETILRSEKLAVVDFWADWCEPCHAMAATVQFLTEDYQGQIVVAKLDVEENPLTPARYNVMGLPTLIFFHNGEEVDRVVGITDITELSERVEKIRIQNKE
jgi:thioredoxin 1